MATGLSNEEISRILAAGMTPRAANIDRYQRYYDGTIYEGRPGFMDDASGVPLQERAPCVVYPAIRNAATSFATMCLGEGRFPRITSLSNEDDKVFDDRFGLNPADSATLDSGITKISEQTRFATVGQQLLETALHSGTAVPFCSIVKGRLRVSQLDPKCTIPAFKADDPETVESVEISYRYVTRDWDPQERAYKAHVWQYRRVIDEAIDVVYVRVEIKNVTEFPTPSVEQTKYRHGFGFCPVLWYKFCAPIATSGDIDGKPIHWGLLSLVDTVNFSLSQRHRAALYCGDPQIVELGVDDDDARMPMGRASEARQPTSDTSGYDEPLSYKRSSGAMTKRRKGAGTVWRYASPDSDVKILSLSGDALKCLDDDAADNIKKLREALGHVYIDPEDITGGGDISGKTLECIYRSQIAKCNRIREDFGACCILPILNMLFRIVLKSGDGLYLAGADKIRVILQRFEQQVGLSAEMSWFSPSLKLKWGGYFEPSDVDEATRIATAIAALTAPTPIITRKTAIEHIQPVFNIASVDQYDDALEKEAQDREAKLHDAMVAMGAGPGIKPDGGTSGAKPAQDAPARSAPAKARTAKPARSARSPLAAP